jgi:hypothetical protein
MGQLMDLESGRGRATPDRGQGEVPLSLRHFPPPSQVVLTRAFLMTGQTLLPSATGCQLPPGHHGRAHWILSPSLESPCIIYKPCM